MYHMWYYVEDILYLSRLRKIESRPSRVSMGKEGREGG